MEEQQREYQKKLNVMLTITSLLLILFLTFHLSDEIARGMERGGFNMLIAVLTLVVWLYGTLVLTGRRSGYIIMLLASIVGTGVPILHMSGAGLAGGRVAPNSSGAFFWVWQNFTLCVISLFCFILAVRGLWSLPWRRSRKSNHANMERPIAQPR